MKSFRGSGGIRGGRAAGDIQRPPQGIVLNQRGLERGRSRMAFDGSLWPLHWAATWRHRFAHLEAISIWNSHNSGRHVQDRAHDDFALGAGPGEACNSSLPASDNPKVLLTMFAILRPKGRRGSLSNQFRDLLGQAGLREKTTHQKLKRAGRPHVAKALDCRSTP